MIEIKKGEFDSKEKLFVNEVEMQKVYLSDYAWSEDKLNRYYFIKISGFENAAVLAQQRLDEFPTRLTLRFHNWLELSEFYIALDIDTVAYSISKTIKFVEGENTVIVVKIVPHLENWNFAYSFNDYKIEFNKKWKEDLKQDIDEIDWIGNSKNNILNLSSIEVNPYFNKTFVTNFSDETISEIVTPFIEIILDCHNKTLDNLKFLKDSNSLSILFDFPEELKITCEQYLLYFAQFLRDLGVNATPNIKEEAGKVLFSVTPTDNIEALDKIREALAVYLNLPSSPIEYDESFAAMRLHQQIDNLQHSQRMAEREIRSSERELRLAQTVIEHQDKIILQKDTIIGQQNKVIEKINSKSIMMDSLENKEEFEKVFDGLEIGESKELKEKLGIRFNPVTSLKTLGNKLIGKGDEINSLNLNEKMEDIDN